jgi:very-short-patch-repair endonuclease
MRLYPCVPHGCPAGRLVVECDGHDFHEKTKQQVTKDNRRERELQIAGWHVFRFSGSGPCFEVLQGH